MGVCGVERALARARAYACVRGCLVYGYTRHWGTVNPLLPCAARCSRARALAHECVSCLRHPRLHRMRVASVSSSARARSRAYVRSHAGSTLAAVGAQWRRAGELIAVAARTEARTHARRPSVQARARSSSSKKKSIHNLHFHYVPSVCIYIYIYYIYIHTSPQSTRARSPACSCSPSSSPPRPLPQIAAALFSCMVCLSRGVVAQCVVLSVLCRLFGCWFFVCVCVGVCYVRIIVIVYRLFATIIILAQFFAGICWVGGAKIWRAFCSFRVWFVSRVVAGSKGANTERETVYTETTAAQTSKADIA